MQTNKGRPEYTHAVLKHDMIVAGLGNNPTGSKTCAMTGIDTCRIILIACRDDFSWVVYVHIVEPAVEISDDVWMIKLSKSSQFAQ